MKKSEVVIRVKSLGLLFNQAIVFGSASALLQYPKSFGREANDIDLVVHPRQFARLACESEWQIEYPECGSHLEIRLVHKEYAIEVFTCWKMHDDVYVPYDELSRSCIEQDGLLCAPVRLVVAYKRYLGRKKDLVDIRKLSRLLQVERQVAAI